jgi:uncharacterized membrane protein (UPF0182 family)
MVLMALGLLVLLVGPSVLDFYTGLLWYASLGYQQVMLTRVAAQWGMFGVGALITFAVLGANLWLVRRLGPRGVVAGMGRRSGPASLLLGWPAFAGAALVALMSGWVVSGSWETVLLFLNRVPFGLADPYFGQDISFYVFVVPLLRLVQGWLVGLTLLALLASAGLYFVAFAASGFRFVLTPSMKAHLSGLLAVFLVLLAWNYQLDIFGLVYSTRGPAYGASYTDINAQWPANNVLTVVVLLAALALLVNVRMRATGLLAGAMALWLVAALLVGSGYPALVQSFEVKPSELAKEAPYIANSIRFTRMAYRLDAVREIDYPAAPEVSLEELRANQATLENVRLWDYRPLLQTYNQIQSIRPYYLFNDVDIDRYVVDGRYRQVMLAVREIDPGRLPAPAQTWVNRKLVYTHGYGLVMNPVNEVVGEGLPRFFLQDIPPTGTLKLARPEVYYGEVMDGYVVVRTGQEEFDYPRGNENVFTRYEGGLGIQLDSYMKRLAFALKFGDTNLILTEYLRPDSLLLWRRNIVSRVEELAPFLVLDKDPYAVLADGRIYWIQDAYTTSDRYPLSQPSARGFNYIRNSVKVVTDAYDGSVMFYVADALDPLVQAYSRIFPSLFRPLSEMPRSLRDHLRYPEDLFTVQADIYRLYHMEDPQAFYNREDVWGIPLEVHANQTVPVEPYYVIMRLPEGQAEEFILFQPFTPQNRPNMIAWMAARNDGEHYGELVTIKFPKDRLVYGPQQVEARIDQDPTISAQLTLWGQRGSQVIRGNLLAIPVARSMLYVEPLYLQAEQSRLPELKRVIVVTGNRIAMEPTLEAALASLYGTQVATGPGPQPPAGGAPSSAPSQIADLARAAQQHYQKAQEALRRGDWAGYGEELKALQDVLDQLVRLTGGF